MALELDHLILAVSNLDAARGTFEAEGFTTFYGGEHASGGTRNALIVFEDGTYVELLAPTGREAPEASDPSDFASLIKDGEGWVGYGLHTSSIERDRQAIEARGLPFSEITSGGRQRPDGTRIGWRFARISGGFSPFLIQDETPRRLRVPDDQHLIQHKNGVTGIRAVRFVTTDLDQSIDLYRRLLGTLPRVDEDSAHFDLAGIDLYLIQASDDAARAHAERRPGAPYLVSFRSRAVTASPATLARKVHGALIDIAPRGVV